MRGKSFITAVLVVLLPLVIAACGGGGGGGTAAYRYTIPASGIHLAGSGKAWDVPVTITNEGGQAGSPWCLGYLNQGGNSVPVGMMYNPLEVSPPIPPQSTRVVTLDVTLLGDGTPSQAEVACANSKVAVGHIASNFATAPLPVTGTTGTSPPPTTTPRSVTASIQSLTGKSLAPGWPAFAAQSHPKSASASIGARSGKLAIAFYSFPTAAAAESFVRPQTAPLANIGGVAGEPTPISYRVTLQEGFTNAALNNDSTVWNFSGGVSIFLRVGSDAILGTYFGPGPANGTDYDLYAIGLSPTVMRAHDLLIGKPTPSPVPKKKGFTALDGASLPDLPSSNWPPLAAMSQVPPAATGATTTTSNDLAYTVTFFDFASVAKATAFYNSPPGAMPVFISGALAYSPLPGSTGVGPPSRGVDMRACGGSANLLPSGKCSGDTGTFSAGPAVIIQRSAVVIMVGYLPTGLVIHASSSSLAMLVGPATSALRLVGELGLG